MPSADAGNAHSSFTLIDCQQCANEGKVNLFNYVERGAVLCQNKNVSNEDLVSRIQSGEDVQNNMLKLWQQNQGMIEELAGKYCHMAEKEDLKQEAYFAICKAVDSYDPDKGSSFLTWAIFWIWKQMQRLSEQWHGANARSRQ